MRRTNFKVPPWQIIAVTDWDNKWDRVLTINTPNGRSKIPQHLVLLTPKVVCVDARDYEWKTYYLTREFDPDFDVSLLGRSHDRAPPRPPRRRRGGPRAARDDRARYDHRTVPRRVLARFVDVDAHGDGSRE